MTLRENLFADDESDRAVSPVIGVILMVAITVILAAVIGTFVLNLSNQTGDTAPQASLSISDADTNYQGNNGDAVINIEASGGETIQFDTTTIVVRNADTNSEIMRIEGGTVTSSSGTGLSAELNGQGTVTDLSGSELQTGDVLTLVEGSSAGFSDDTEFTVTVIDQNSEKQIAQSTVRVQ